MTTYARDLAAVDLSLFGIRIEGAAGDGKIVITMPKFIEHTQGQDGDAVHHKTGITSAPFQVKVLQSADVNVDLIGVVNASLDDQETNGQGAFYCNDRNTGQIIQGNCTLDGYPDSVEQKAEDSAYTYSGMIYDVRMTAE